MKVFIDRFLPMIAILCLSFGSSAQSSFSVSPTFLEATRPANVFVFYNFAQFTNHTSDALKMRWVKELLQGGHGGVIPPPEWSVAISDPSNAFDPADTIVSADFDLLPNTSSTLEKFVYSVFPKDTPGKMKTKFTFYALDHPGDSTAIFFTHEGTDFTSAVTVALDVSNISVTPNPAYDIFTVENNFTENVVIKLQDLNGRTIRNFTLAANALKTIDSSDFAVGMYLMEIKSKERLGQKKIVVLR